MSDIAKWALLAAAAVLLIGMIAALPFVEFIDFGQFSAALANITTVAGSAFRFGRGLINNFLLPFGRTVATGLFIWLVGKWALMIAIKIVAWAYHFIFK